MINVSQIWNSLGTAFSQLQDTDKTKVETSWQMMIDSLGLFYNKFLGYKENWSLLLSKPFIFLERSYYTFYSTVSSRTSGNEVQSIDDLLIYSDLLELYNYSVSGLPLDTPTSSGIDFTQTESQTLPDTAFTLSAIYVLTTDGFQALTLPLWDSEAYTNGL